MIHGTTPVDMALLAQGQQGSPWAGLVPMLLIMVIFYLLLILPAQKRQKKQNEMLAALKTGDKVVTQGGIYGTIVGLEDQSVQLKVADQVRIRVARSAIAGMQPEVKEE